MKRWIAGWMAATLVAGAVAADKGPPLLVGQSAGFTGGQAQYSADVKQGIEAYFQAVNKAGGVNGRSVQLVTEDDQGKKDLVVANTRKLVDRKVVALVGYTSGAGVEAALKYLDESGMPMLSPVTGNMGIRAEFHRSLFHTRAGYDDEMRKLVGSLALTGVRRFAIAYLDDVGPGNPKAMHDALEANGLKALAAVPLNRNATDFGSQAEALLKADPEVVLFISNATPLVKIVQAMRAKGYTGRFAASSFASLKVVDDLKEQAGGLIMSQVLPQPGKTFLKVVKDYQEHLAEAAPGAKPNYTSLEGYIAARVLVEGLRRAGPNPTPDKLVAALEGIRRLDLGGYEIDFSARSHNGSRYVDTAVVTSAGALRF